MIDTSPYIVRRSRNQWVLTTPTNIIVAQRATQRLVTKAYLELKQAGELPMVLDPGGLRHGYHIGVTGTRQEPLPHQRWWLEHTMTAIAEDLRSRGIGRGEGGSEIIYFHHGDCVGVDQYAHNIARFLGWPVIGHPPREKRFRAYCKPMWMICEEMGYLARNRVMVAAINLLLSVPKDPITPESIKGYHGKGISGTSYTTTMGLNSGIEVRVCPTVIGHHAGGRGKIESGYQESTTKEGRGSQWLD
jgi:hypothetical protein